MWTGSTADDYSGVAGAAQTQRAHRTGKTFDRVSALAMESAALAGQTTLLLAGEFDLSTRPCLHSACVHAQGLDPAVHVVVNMTAVSFIDGGGVGEITELVRARRALGDPSFVKVASSFQWRLFWACGSGDVTQAGLACHVSVDDRTQA